ncbi:MAG: hypothetical protein KAQ98_05200 [Bacteriovoracaceae bacterium]|nr:hypothetical protein [Bacteriovoracaceae bacterium]
MSVKKIISVVLGLFVIASIIHLVAKESKQPNIETSIAEKRNPIKKQIDAFYFHTTSRCYSCELMEKYINEALDENFSVQMKKGVLNFQAINVDRQENRHYIQDYKLFTKSFILSMKKNGNEDKWFNCEKIWNLVRDKNMFKRYIKKEVKKYLEEI